MRQRFLLGPWRVEPAANRLTDERETVRLEPKVMDLLLTLAERPDEVMSREWLLERVWPGVHVSDEALTTTVYQLRRALRDDSRAPRFVETVPKRGYRLLVRPEPVEASRPFGGGAATRPPRPHRGRGAVLAAALGWAALCLGPTGGPPGAADLPARGAAAPVERVEALHRRALERAHRDWDFRGAEGDVRRALAIDPDRASSHALMAQLHFVAGREREALVALGRARRSAPRDASVHRLSGTLAAAFGHRERAAGHFRRALALDPQDREAARGLAKLVEPSDAPDRAAVVDRIAATLSRGPVTPVHVAGLYAELGAADQAFGWLDRAWHERDPGLFFLRYDDRWRAFQDDPRFRGVIDRLDGRGRVGGSGAAGPLS